MTALSKRSSAGTRFLAVLFFPAMPAKKIRKAKRALRKKGAPAGKLAVIGSTGKKPAKAARLARTVGAGTDPKRVTALLGEVGEGDPGANCEFKHQKSF